VFSGVVWLESGVIFMEVGSGFCGSWFVTSVCLLSERLSDCSVSFLDM